MSRPAPLVCLITPGHIASTPRLVKNADALAAAGYRVHVVAGRHFPPVDPLDESLFAQAPWAHTRVDGRHGSAVVARKLLRRVARRWIQLDLPAGARLAARAHHAETLHLARTAAQIPAQLYIGHCLAGLPAAAFAARARGVPYAFDAEDFHEGEDIAESHELRARRTLLARLLPACAFITAASPMIGERYREIYRIEPTTLLNVFPLAESPSAPFTPPPISAERPACLYWFSQTIGPGRGLEAAIAILGKMRTPVELHLRGFISADYAARLRLLATTAKLSRPLRFLPPAAPAEMIPLAATADLGLSIEESQPLNRDLCLTNKIFTYLLAGVPQWLSSTRAQTAFAPALGRSALLGDLTRPDETARLLDAFLADSKNLIHARETAWRLARERYCWDVEQAALLRLVDPLLRR
jgi:hypothetical protein